MRPLMLKEQSQQTRHSFVLRTSQSTRERLRHSSHRLKFELQANQRRHVSQSSSFTGDQLKTLTADFFLDSAKSELLERFRKTLEPSSLPLKPDFYETLETSLKDVEELLPGLPEIELIELLRAFADKLDEMLYPPNDDAPRIRIWGKRLEGLCRLLPSSPSEQSPKQALISRAQALMGMLSPSIIYLNSIGTWDDHNLHAAGTVILAVACHRNLLRSLHLILFEIPYLSNCTQTYTENVIQILLSRTPNVLAVIPKAVQENWSLEMKRSLGNLLLSTNRDPKLLGGIIAELQANNIGVSRNQILLKTGRLLSTKEITTAPELHHSIRTYIRHKLKASAWAGNSKQAQSFFDKLKARGEVDRRDIENLLFSYAEDGNRNVPEVYRVFDEYFPKNDEGRRLNDPDVYHYSAAMLAHARVEDFDAVITWLKDMERSGLRPNRHTFSTVIQALSKTNNLQGVSDVFYKMRKLGGKPSITVYNILLQLHADRKDSEGAESLYKLTFEDGIIPSLQMTQLLMDAFAKSGSLVGAVRIFNFLISQSITSRSVYNTVMGAHVLMGAPFDVVSRLFSKLKSMQLVDRHTYFLLVNSACNSGQSRTATNIYYDMVKEEQENPSLSLVFAPVPTLIMSASLRQGDKEQAKEIYDHMIKRGIRPSSVTYGELVISYLKEGTPESLRSAEEFIKSLVSDAKEDHKLDEDDSIWKPIHLYGHLLNFYGLQRNVAECERLYGEYLEGGGKPTVAMLSHILEAYRGIYVCRKGI